MFFNKYPTDPPWKACNACTSPPAVIRTTMRAFGNIRGEEHDADVDPEPMQLLHLIVRICLIKIDLDAWIFSPQPMQQLGSQSGAAVLTKPMRTDPPWPTLMSLASSTASDSSCRIACARARKLLPAGKSVTRRVFRSNSGVPSSSSS